MKRIVLLGCYAAFNCASVKIKELIDQYAGTGISGFKFFLTSSGAQVPGHPIFPQIYDKAKKIFLFKNAVINPEFVDRLAEYGESILGAGLDMGIVLFNRSHLKSRAKNFVFKKNPLRDNDLGINWGGDDTVKYLYNSITFGANNTHTNYWKKWIDVNEKKLQFTFGDVGELGKGLSAYIQAVADTLVPIAKKNTGRLFIMGRNEERAGGDGDRSELTVFEKECFEATGVAKWGVKFHRVVNRDSDVLLDQLHPSITGPYAGSTKTNKGKLVVGCLGAKHEVHLKSNAMKQQIIGWGYDRAKTIFSSDGWDEKTEAFVSGNKKLYQSGDHVDLLFEEAVLSSPDPVHEIDKNLKNAASIYKEITK